MKIIFIHGMNQQNYTAHRLKEHWLKVFKLGLKQMPCRVNVRDLHIHMPFYGDLMTKYQLSNQLDLNTLLPKSFLIIISLLTYTQVILRLESTLHLFHCYVPQPIKLIKASQNGFISLLN